MKDFNKTNSFKTPEGYLEAFTGKLMDKIAIGESRITKDQPFKVPVGYFEGFNDNIARETTAKQIKVIPLNPYRRYLLVAASVAAIIILVSVTIGVDRTVDSPAQMTFDDLAGSDIENYFEINDLDLTTYEIAEMIPVDELEVGDLLDNPFKENTVVDYLNENIEEFEDLNLDNNE